VVGDKSPNPILDPIHFEFAVWLLWTAGPKEILELLFKEFVLMLKIFIWKGMFFFQSFYMGFEKTFDGLAISPISFKSGSINTFSIAAEEGAKSPYEAFWPCDFVLAVCALWSASPMLTDPLFETLLILKLKILITVCILSHPF
jgi:hypothetical protein